MNSEYQRQLARNAERARLGIKPTVHNASTYNNWDCRCELCRKDWAALIARHRVKRRPEDAKRHGVYSTYSNWKCRCDPCRTAWAAYERARYWAKKEGKS